MIDCLLIGHNEGDFPQYVELVRALGERGPWRRVNLAFVDIDGVPHRAMDVLNRYNGRDGVRRPALTNFEPFSPTIAYLASYLAARGFSVDYANLFQAEKPAIAATLATGRVRTVAITTTFYVGTWWIEEIVQFVRAHDPSVRIVVGGPYIANQAQVAPDRLDELFEQIGADVYVINREGEAALARVLDAVRSGRTLEGIDNIAWRDGGAFRRSAASVESNPLGENLVDYARFPRRRFGEFLSTRTAKSCPFTCSFCAFPQQAGAYAYEPVSTVERDLDRIRAIGTITTLTFLDDTFNVPQRRFKDILRMMIRNGYGFRWNSFLRADHVDDEAIELMRESGCEGVFLGVESGSDTILKVMNKTSRSAHYRAAIPKLRAAGILTHCSVIVGFPGETRDTVRETIDLIEETRPDTYRSQLWYCDPMTPIWKKRDELGLRGTQFEWSHPTMDSTTAADIVDEMFVDVKGSTWLPQHGFESWSLFYLQRKGMPLAQMMRFLRDFNRAVEFRLRNPEARSLPAPLLRTLRTSSRFEGADSADAPTPHTRRRPGERDAGRQAASPPSGNLATSDQRA